MTGYELFMPDVPQYICFILMPLNRPSTKCFQYKRLYDETTRPLTTTKLISCKVLGWVESLFNILFVLLAHDVIVTKKKSKISFKPKLQMPVPGNSVSFFYVGHGLFH